MVLMKLFVKDGETNLAILQVNQLRNISIYQKHIILLRVISFIIIFHYFTSSFCLYTLFNEMLNWSQRTSNLLNDVILKKDRLASRNFSVEE